MNIPLSGPDGDEATTQHRRHLARGLNWLGGATAIARLTDVATIIVVLLYLTQDQVGIGSLVVSFGMMIEAFDGLGTGDAIIQAGEVTRRHLDGLFWYVIVIALVISGLTLAAAPILQFVYHVPGMAPYFIAIAIKQPLVGAAVIPMALLSRDLRYERIAAINVVATFGAALARLAVAMLGGGAWALVWGFMASGAFTLLGSLWARPFLPACRFSFETIRPFVRFGLRSAGAHIVDQVFKNIDFLLVGWFYGPTPLALYRVIFDVAMEPAVAVGTLINRTALPVFARAARVPAELKAALLWALQRLATLVGPCMVAIMILALPLTSLLHDSRGHSYAAGALPLQILAAAALLRVTSQLIPPLLLASGRPGTAAGFSTATFLMLGCGLLVVGASLPASTGLVAIACLWLGLYPPLMAWGVRYLRRHWQFRVGELIRPFLEPALAVAMMAGAAGVLGRLPFGRERVFRIVIVLIVAALTYAGLFLRARRGRASP